MLPPHTAVKREDGIDPHDKLGEATISAFLVLIKTRKLELAFRRSLLQEAPTSPLDGPSTLPSAPSQSRFWRVCTGPLMIAAGFFSDS